ncbi:fibrinolytic enzyme isozyme C, partial [Biomphalaria pfeifferi]
VLTAAHCVEGVDVSDLRAVVGLLNLYGPPTGYEQFVSISKINMYEDHWLINNNEIYDIAVLTLATPVRPNKNVETVSDSLLWMSSSEIANTGPNHGRDRNIEFDFGSGIRENSMLGNCIQAIDMNCMCGTLRRQCPCQKTQRQDLNLTEICTSDHISESDLKGGELIPAKPNAMVDEHYKGASWAYLTDEAEKDYELETMSTSGPTTVSRDVHGRGPLTRLLRTTTLESTVIATISICSKRLTTLNSTNFPCVRWLTSATI